MEERDPVPITAAPGRDQLVAHNGKTYATVKEGNAYILVPPNARTSVNPNAKAKAEEEQKVFYNPIQQFNRDLSVLAIKAYGEELSRRKTAAREVKKKREDGKRERKKQRNAEQGRDGVGQNAGNGADATSEVISEAMNGDAEGESKKRKRSDREDGDAEERATKVQKAGDSASLPVEDNANGATATEPRSNGVNDPGNHEGATKSAGRPDAGLKAWQPSFRILDALSATGLRALRYATEIPTATAIVANDRDRHATDAIALNIQHNDLASKISTSTGDAMGHMYAAAFPFPNSHGPNHVSKKYDVIDLDPYGTAAPFIDSALQAINEEGMLCVTCTDSGVWASCGYSEKTFSLYGGMPIKGNHAHEGGLRLILNSIAASAARYSLAIEPLLSLSIDFYARLFIRVRKSPAEVKFLAGKTMLVYDCDVGCGAWTTQFLGRHQRHGKGDSSWKFHIPQAPSSDKLCEHCGSKRHIAGPMWGGPLHNAAFVGKILEEAEKADQDVYQTLPRIEGMLDTALSELEVFSELLQQSTDTSTSAAETSVLAPTYPYVVDHHPFYFIPSALCKVIKAVAPPEACVRGALRRLGYVATRSHTKAGTIKTDAPFAVIWEVMREWVRQRSPVKLENLREGGPGWKILNKTRRTPAKEVTQQGQGEAEAVKSTNGEVPTSDAATSSDTPDITTAAPAPPQQPPSKPQAEPGKELDVSKLDIVFDEKLGRDKERPGGKKRLVRYQQNPRENWGPMARAKGKA